MELEKKNNYKESLNIVGSLSTLFTESDTAPFLYYRIAEKLFCESFKAQNRSRSDVSVDATHGEFGIGLKTFLHQKGSTFQKVAEFNAISQKYKGMNDFDTIIYISEARNNRLLTTSSLYDSKRLIYHLVTRLRDEFRIYETDMPTIDIQSIKESEVKNNRGVILFKDGANEYGFNTSKSTLFKRFCLNDISPLDQFEVKVLSDPLSKLRECFQKHLSYEKKKTIGVNFVYLPLYSTRKDSYGEVPEKSGLNQWNAAGRVRDANEVYIPVPSFIHQNAPGFFPDNNEFEFFIELPNGKKLDAKLCQEGSKGLMSNPNKALGRWLLRDVFKMEEGVLINKDILLEKGIDSVYVEKINDRNYVIDFAGIGKYEDFVNSFN